MKPIFQAAWKHNKKDSLCTCPRPKNGQSFLRLDHWAKNRFYCVFVCSYLLSLAHFCCRIFQAGFCCWFFRLACIGLINHSLNLYQTSIQFHAEYPQQPQFLRLGETDLSYFIDAIGSGSLKYEDIISLEYEYFYAKQRMTFLKINHGDLQNPAQLKLLLNTIQQPHFDAQLRHRLTIFRALRKYELI